MKESLLQVRTHNSVTTPTNRRVGLISWMISSVAFVLIAQTEKHKLHKHKNAKSMYSVT